MSQGFTAVAPHGFDRVATAGRRRETSASKARLRVVPVVVTLFAACWSAGD